MTTKTATFEMNGKTYKTDEETVEVLRTVVPRAKVSGDASAVTAVMGLGLEAGRIVEEPTYRKGMRVQSASERLPHQMGTVRTHFGMVTGLTPDGQRVYVLWDGCEQEDEMFVHELEMERPCPHPASRQYAWHAYNHLTNKTDALCICCCDCGAVLKGGASLASEEPQS